MKKNIVWVVETDYKNGQHELNAIYFNKDDADKFVEFMKEHDGTNDMFIDKISVRDMFVLGTEIDIESKIKEVVNGYKDEIPSDIRSMIVNELASALE